MQQRPFTFETPICLCLSALFLLVDVTLCSQANLYHVLLFASFLHHILSTPTFDNHAVTLS